MASFTKVLSLTRKAYPLLRRWNYNFAQLNNLGNSRKLKRQKSKFAAYEPSQIVYESENTVPLSGTVNIEAPYNVEIAPLDVELTIVDKAIFKLISTSTDETQVIKNLCTFDASLTNSNLKISGSLEKKSLNPSLLCVGEIPLQYDVNAVLTEDGSFAIEDLESKSISVETKAGNITCKRLKCEQMKFRSKSGSIRCPGVMQGNIDIKTFGDGRVSGVRFQGSDIHVETENGAVYLSAIYASMSSFKSVFGQLDLDNYHGNGIINVKHGDVNITGLDGSLRAEVETGNISVQVSRLDGLYLTNKQGNVEVKLPMNLQSRVEIEAKEISVEKRLQVQGEFERKNGHRTFSGFLGAGHGPVIIIFALQGSVKLSVQDWMSSLQLGDIIPEFSPKEEIK